MADPNSFREVLAWGMDFYTKKNIYYLLIRHDEARNYEFVEEVLPRAMNQQEFSGHLLNSSLEFILAS
jgi:hypothetical protein